MTWTGRGPGRAVGETCVGGLLLEGGSAKTYRAVALTLTAHRPGRPASVRFWNAATLNNNSTFDIQTDEDLRSVGPGPPRLFINNGTVRKTAGTNVTSIGAYMFNGGLVEVSSGAISFGQTFSQSPTGTLKVRIGGITPTVGFDSYSIAQSATLSGTLVITLVIGYEPIWAIPLRL